ncbi:MAG: hypothetical protein M1832_002157 [Thelocarpon impressellum]|nr:MAG: hypothetical protein M1832_002157 [Thelocarpon impressellum]
MPRQRRSAPASAPRRPVPAPARPNVTPPQPQSRAATTLARPVGPNGQPPQVPAKQGQQPQQPGLFGQMASTAAGVAVGSSIGHAIGGFFGGGSSTPVEEAQQANAATSQGYDGAATTNQDNWGTPSCEVDARQFTKCLDENQGNMQICGWYLEQLKACQQAAKQY